MSAALNPLKRLRRRRSNASRSEKLYGVIVAQARLPRVYKDLGVPDSSEGRFTVLSLHLFIVLRRLKQGGMAAFPLAQEVMDCFVADMDTVLRELGVSDLRVPKKMRALAGSAHALLETYDRAFAAGEAQFAAAIAASLPPQCVNTKLTSRALASYLKRCAAALEHEPLSAFAAGVIAFPGGDNPKR